MTISRLRPGYAIPIFFLSYKNIKNARHINASVQVSKIRYLSQGLARRINTINTMITVLLR